MSAERLIREVQKIGGSLSLNGDKVRYRMPRNHPQKDRLLAELRAHKQELIAELRRSQGSPPPPCGSPECGGCYEVAPGIRIHPPKPSAEWLAWLAKWEPKGGVQ